MTVKQKCERHSSRARGPDSVGRLIKCVMLLCLVPMALAEDSSPTDAQVRSAYCIPVLQQQMQAQRRMIAAIDNAPKEMRRQAEEMNPDARRQLAQMESLLSRLQASVRPLTPYPDGGALSNAQQRGAEDFDGYNATLKRCATKCFAAGPSIDKCENECSDHELIARIKACFTPNWLPQ